VCTRRALAWAMPAVPPVTAGHVNAAAHSVLNVRWLCDSKIVGTSNFDMIMRVVDSGKMRCITAASSRPGATGPSLCACVINLSSFLMYLYWRYSSHASEALSRCAWVEGPSA
jgi:hypothetical protein